VTIWVDGALVDDDAARISPMDHGLLTGDGVFETLRVYGGVPFAWTRHVARLGRSAGALGLVPPDGATLRAAADAVIAANDLPDARLRITVTGGVAPLGSERGSVPPTVVIASGEMRPWPPTADVVVVPWVRNERGATSGLKTTSYAENVRALAFAHERGASEAIFPNTQDLLCEGTGSNVFLVVDGGLVTPPLASGCLAGVTRDLVLLLCERIGIACAERDVPVASLAAADEAFLTSSTREVHPIAHVDGHALPVAPGPITRALQDAWRDLLADDLDP
jgi:branched-chain amino acid aminotransferase